jgi:hypothetical protein
MRNKKKEVEPWEELAINKSSYYKYLSLGMPKEMAEAKAWIEVRAGLAQQGSGKIQVGGQTFSAKDLIDLRGKVLQAQEQNLQFKNRLEALNVAEREARLVDSGELSEVLVSILYPLRQALDALPENLASALNPTDPARAESILEQELHNIYDSLCKNLEKDERTKKISY